MKQPTTKSLGFAWKTFVLKTYAFFTLKTLVLKTLAVTLVVGGLAGCSRREPGNSPTSSQSPSQIPLQTVALRAALLSPIDVKLTWKDPAPNAAGYIVEYATEPQGEFTLERFCADKRLAYAHHDNPVPLKTFTAYGTAFQQRLVPDLEDESVIALKRCGSMICCAAR